MHSAATASIRRISPAAAIGPRFYSSTIQSNLHLSNNPEVLRQLVKSREQYQTFSSIRNAPGWNQHLATPSEAAVKADRSDHQHLSEMTEDTLEYVQAEYSSETAELSIRGKMSEPHAEYFMNDERIDAREASYERDEIWGPLKSSGVVNDTKRNRRAWGA